MSKPVSTRSKPCKIGRKHTTAASVRCQSKQAKAREMENRIKGANAKRLKAKVAAFWRGELDSFPEV